MSVFIQMMAKDVSDYVITDKWAYEGRDIAQATCVWYFFFFLMNPFMLGLFCYRVVASFNVREAVILCFFAFLVFCSFAALKEARHLVREHEYILIDKKLEEL